MKKRTKTKWTRIRFAWHAMMARCYRRHHMHYKNYGARGITVCKRWHKYENFLTDMVFAPKRKSLERVNNNKGYCKNNCKWATPKEQGRNRRTTKIISYDGKKLTMGEWAEHLGLKVKTLRYRTKQGFPKRFIFCSSKFIGNNQYKSKIKRN